MYADDRTAEVGGFPYPESPAAVGESWLMVTRPLPMVTGGTDIAANRPLQLASPHPALVMGEGCKHVTIVVCSGGWRSSSS